MKDNLPQEIPGLAQYLPAKGSIAPAAKVYDTCKECGTKLYGGERSGSDANGYCDGCNS